MNKRLLPIAELLLKESKYVTTDHIANSLNVSNKTIRNDIIELETIIKDFDLILDKKTGSGIAIIGNDNRKLSLLSKLKSICKSIIAYSPEDRKLFILKKLLTTDHNLSIGYFSSCLYISRATVHKDLLVAEEWLKSYNISLVRNPRIGTSISAKEKNIRKALGDLICSDMEYIDTKQLLSSGHESISSLPSFKSFDDILNIDFSDLRETLFSVEELNLETCSDESLITLMIHISIAMNRVSKHKYVGISEKSHGIFVSKPEYIYVELLAKNLSSKYNIDFPDAEITYLFLLILGINLSNNNTPIPNNFSDKVSYSDSTIIVADIINKWESILNIPLNEDNKLLSSLVLHLNPVLHRLKYSLPIHNPILNEIKSTYTRTYTVASYARDIIKTHTGYNIPDSEIGYLAIHLVSAIDRNEKSLETVLVCHSSVSVAELLYTKITRGCTNINIVSCISLNALNEYDFSSVDLVLTTVPITLDVSCDIISINTLLRKEDVSRLNNTVSKLYKKKNDITPSINL